MHTLYTDTHTQTCTAVNITRIHDSVLFSLVRGHLNHGVTHQ